MRPKYGWIEEWTTPVDEDVTLIKGIAAFVTFGLFVVAMLGSILLVWAAQP